VDRVCLLDLDGVLVDMMAGAQKLAGVNVHPADVRWDVSTQLGFPSPEAFWSKAGYDFWANLPWHHEGPRLLTGLEMIYGRESIALLTSPVDTPGAVEGKVAWIRHHMPDYRRRFFVGPAKHLVAGPNVRLVDDHDPNVDGFVAAGGHATLVPRPWNRRQPETNHLGRFNVETLLQEIAAAREAS
jgi:hypothetical protein